MLRQNDVHHWDSAWRYANASFVPAHFVCVFVCGCVGESLRKEECNASFVPTHCVCVCVCVCLCVCVWMCVSVRV